MLTRAILRTATVASRQLLNAKGFFRVPQDGEILEPAWFRDLAPFGLTWGPEPGSLV